MKYFYATYQSGSISGRKDYPPVRTFCFLLFTVFALLYGTILHAEGTKQLAPNPDEIVMLLINNDTYGNFGAYDGPANSRLYFRIDDPGEVVHLGLSRNYRANGQAESSGSYNFRIRRLSDGAVVHGPFTVHAFNENVSSWEDATLGPAAITGQGYETTDDRFFFDPSESGDYYIEFADATHIGFWDITVAKDNQIQSGRIFSANWAFRTPADQNNPPECVWDREFNGILYSYTSDGFVTKIDFSNSGFQGLSFNVAFNSTGPGNSGDPQLDRMSVEGENLTENSAEHLIFLNEPDPAQFPDGVCGSATVGESFLCTADGGFCLQATATQTGQLEIVLDFDKNGVYDEGLDIRLLEIFDDPDDLNNCIAWDGFKGDGTQPLEGETVDLLVQYTQGVQHWALFDGEFLKNGFCIEPVRPVCGGDQSSLLYWDDRSISDEPGTSAVKDGRLGCDCEVENCRTWNYFNPNTDDCRFINDNITLGYGDKSTLNTWWFARNVYTTYANIPFPAGVSIEGEMEICELEETLLSAAITSSEVVSIIWTGPNGVISEGGAENTTVLVSEPGTYSVTVEESTGCSNTATHELAVIVCPADVELDKLVDHLNPEIGQVLTYEIVLTNKGPGIATGITVEDQLPDGLTDITGISDGGLLQENGITWTGLSLNEGETIVLTYRARVNLGFNYTNLAEITAMDQQDIDSTPGNGVDTNNNGNVSDDPEDEDDGDGVVLTPEPCSLGASIGQVICDDNGTPVDPADDTFTFEVTINAGNASSGWIANDPEGSSGVYGQAFQFGPYPISGGVVSFQIQDQFFGGVCSIPISVTPPATCSDQCLIETAVSNLFCNDNGTPSDPADDTYSFDLTVTGFNTGNNWTLGEVTAAYGETVSFGPFAIGDGASQLTITDGADGSCTAELIVQPPSTCSGQCVIEADIESIYCDDNGTASDPADDVYYADLFVSGANTSDQGFTIGNTTGIYNTLITVGPFPIAGGAVSLELTDLDDPACKTTVDLTAPETCSDACELFAEVINVICNDNGTPTLADDDLFTFEVIISGFNLSDNWQSETGVTGSYGVPTIFGPFPIAEGTVSILISDGADPNCTIAVEVATPAPCSDNCAITDAGLRDIRCDDNGTPSDPSDDTYTFTVNVAGNNVSESGWSSNLEISGAYNTDVTFGPYPISEGGKTVILADKEEADCQIEFSVTAPTTCSEQCAIEATAFDVLCFDNGTPSNKEDDVFEFKIIVEALNNAGSGWIANDGTIGNYEEAVTFGPFPIREGNKTIVINSVDFPDCQYALEIEAPETCSDQCLIEEVEVLSVVCNDNNTPEDSQDDFFTYTVIVNGVNLAESWTASDGTTGAYGVPVTSVPHPVSEGGFSVAITDDNDDACQYEIAVTSPPISIECPEDAFRATVNRNALILEARLEVSDPRFDEVDSLCWLPGDLFEAGDHYYDPFTLRYNSDSEEPEVFTFYLFSNIPGKENFPLGLDGAGALFLGPYYPDDPCCYLQSSDVRATTGEVGMLLDQPLVDPSGLFSQPYDAIAKFSVLMTPNEAYSLLTTTFLPETGGAYAWMILSEPGVELELATGDVELEDRQEITVGMELTFFDRDFVLNNPESIDALGFPTINNYCGVDSINFADQITDLGECTDLIINRKFKVYGYGSTEALDSCEQELTLRRPSLNDIVLPPEAVLYACGATYDTLANGLPAPSAAGFPLVLTQSGYIELSETFNNNLTITYKDNIVDIPGSFTQTFSRDWAITDICEDTLLRYSQLIKIGGFTNPIVECPVSNHYCPILEGNIMLFPMDPFDCSATVEAPLPDIINTCGDQEWMVRTEVLQVSGPDTLILAIFEPGEDRIISDLAAGDYLFRYTVFDDEGHQVEKQCVFRVADTQEPTAICRSDIEFFLTGIGDRTLTAEEINQGSYDNCGVAKVEIRRVYQRDPVTCDTLLTPDYSDWAESVVFGCCDLGRYVTVEMRVTDIHGIENTCWLDILVEDQEVPTLSGVSDRTVNCAAIPDNFNPEDSLQLSTLFGFPTVTSNCEAAVIELTPDLQLLECGSGIIERRFQLVRPNGQRLAPVYSQLITIEAYLEYEIGFPADAVTDCVSWSDTVLLQKTACDSLEITYEDQFLDPIEGECYRIARTYHVISHCEWDGVSEAVVINRDETCKGVAGTERVWVLRQPELAFVDQDTDGNNNVPAGGSKGTSCDGNTNPNGHWRTAESTGYWVYTQEIRVSDDLAPSIAFVVPDPICTTGPACTAEVNYPFTVDDACVLETFENLKVEWDADADGTIDADLTNTNLLIGTYPHFTLSGDFPIGSHELRVTATDYCGNTATATLPFSVVDCYLSDPICQQVVVDLVSLDPPVDLDGDGSNEVAGVTVSVEDLVAFDNTECSEPLRLSLNRIGELPDINRTTISYTCDDRYSDSLEVYLWDSAYNPYRLQPDSLTQGGPNYKSCQLEIYIQDTNEVCPDCTSSPVVGGIVATENGTSLPMVALEINGEEMGALSIAENGSFQFDDLQAGPGYTIAPHWDQGHRNGVSTMDLILARAHLLGLNYLDSPYQIIAADVNNSGTITTLDLLELRQILLGEIDRFPNNTSWRFVDQHYQFPDRDNPWNEVFPESVVIDELLTCVNDLDFTAIKVGDLDGSAHFESNSFTSREHGEPFQLLVEDRVLEAGESIWLPFELDDLRQILGFQFTLGFDPALVAVEQLTPGLLNQEHIGKRFVPEGALTFSWEKQAGGESSKRESITAFSLKISAKAPIRLREVFEISSRITAAEAYRNTGEATAVELSFAQKNNLPAALKLFQNRPNPFADHTIISFELPLDGTAEVEVLDVSGRSVWRQTGHFPAGYSELKLTNDDLSGSGMYYYFLRTSFGTLTKKLIVVE